MDLKWIKAEQDRKIREELANDRKKAEQARKEKERREKGVTEEEQMLGMGFANGFD